jgi:signal transduction histidine kinase
MWFSMSIPRMTPSSHELKIPMTSIKGYAKLLEMTAGAALNDQQKEFLRIIGSNIDRMNRLVSDLLDVSRIEAGRLQLELEEVSIRDVVDEVVQSVETQIQKKELNLAIDIPPAIPKVWADHGRMVQVMTNLISNAYKYTPGGGRIAVGAQERGSRNNGRHISIYVTDTGLGIAEAEQEQLFNKFFRADNPAVREEPGTHDVINISMNISPNLLVQTALDTTLVSCLCTLQTKRHGRIIEGSKRRDESQFSWSSCFILI